MKLDVPWFIYFYRRTTCFRRFFRPSSGAHNCTYSFRYCQPILLLAATVNEMKLEVPWFIYFYRRTTCFRRFLRPSSGAHNFTYSFRYCQPILLLTATVNETKLTVPWFISPYRRTTCFRRFLCPSSGAHNCTYSFRCQVLLVSWMSWNCVPTHPWHQQYLTTEAVCTVMCSWWWAEEPPETCSESVERNKSRNVASCWL